MLGARIDQRQPPNNSNHSIYKEHEKIAVQTINFIKWLSISKISVWVYESINKCKIYWVQKYRKVLQLIETNKQASDNKDASINSTESIKNIENYTIGAENSPILRKTHRQ